MQSRLDYKDFEEFTNLEYWYGHCQSYWFPMCLLCVRIQVLTFIYQNKRKTWRGLMIRNVLTRRREYGTYLATARRHRRRIKMQKRDE